MKLSDTCNLMCSTDYKDRFVAEYQQLRIRYDKLSEMVSKYISGELNFEPRCSIAVLKKQLVVMEEYLEVLQRRANIEGISLAVSATTTKINEHSFDANKIAR